MEHLGKGGRICEPRKLGITLAPLLCCQHCYSYPCCTLQLRKGSPPLENDIRRTLLKGLRKQESFHGGIVENLGHCVGCVKVCNTGLGTGDWELLCVFFSPPPRLFKSNQLRQGASHRHYQVDFRKNKSSSAILYAASGRKKKLNRNHIQRRYSACVWVCVSCYFNHFFQKIISPDNLTLSPIYLSLQSGPKTRLRYYKVQRSKLKLRSVSVLARCI